MMISQGFGYSSNDEYLRVKSLYSSQSCNNSNDALTNSITQPIKPYSPPLSPISSNSCNDQHANAENAQFDEQLKHLQKNNNMYLNGKENFNSTSIKISPAELMNGKSNDIQTNGHHLSEASISLSNKSLQR